MKQSFFNSKWYRVKERNTPPLNNNKSVHFFRNACVGFLSILSTQNYTCFHTQYHNIISITLKYRASNSPASINYIFVLLPLTLHIYQVNIYNLFIYLYICNYFCSLCVHACTYIRVHIYHIHTYTHRYIHIGYSIFIELSYIDINTDICITYICTYIHVLTCIQITSYA